MTDPLPSAASLKTRLTLALLAAFALGMMAGGALAWFAVPGKAPRFPGGKHDPPHGFPPGRPEDMPQHLADKLCEELGLEEALREPVRRIFREGFVESEPIRQRAGEEMKAVFDRQNQKLAALLTPEQQERFARLKAQWDKKRGPEPPPPPPPR